MLTLHFLKTTGYSTMLGFLFPIPVLSFSGLVIFLSSGREWLQVLSTVGAFTRPIIVGVSLLLSPLFEVILFTVKYVHRITEPTVT